MSKFKLSYFDFSASRGDECRLALALAKLPFEDDRVPSAAWATRKAEMPFGQMPVLEVPGKGRLTQVNAILTYIGREYGLHPTDSWQAAKHEEIMAACEDVRMQVASTIRISDEAEKVAKRQSMASTTIPAWAAGVQALLGDGPFVAGADISVADVKIYMIAKWFKSGVLDHIPATVLDPYPKILRVHDHVSRHPIVVDWYAAHS